MWRTYQLLVAAKGSPSKLVQHSPALADIFGRHIQELETCPVRGSRVRKMKYVKHRFNSSAVPLQRSILFFEAVWRFCMECLAVRAGTEPAKQAGEFLQNVTEEAVIQAAMMAEAADEHLLLRRWFDSDAWDAASIGRQLDSFLNKLRYMSIVPPGSPIGKAGCENHGFVQYAIQMLSQPHVAWVRGTQCVLGGPNSVTRDIMSRCLSRMANWIRLTIAAVSAEFPSWQLTCALEIFELRSDAHHDDEAAAPAAAEAATKFERLATAFGLDLPLLREEYAACEHVASAAYRQRGIGTNADAWAIAVQKLHARSKSDLARSPLARLVHILQCWTGLSTSAIEQSFGKAKSVVTGDHRHCSEVNESMEARLACDLRGAPEAYQAKVFKEAGLMWTDLWVRTRTRGKLVCQG